MCSGGSIISLLSALGVGHGPRAADETTAVALRPRCGAAGGACCPSRHASPPSRRWRSSRRTKTTLVVLASPIIIKHNYNNNNRAAHARLLKPAASASTRRRGRPGMASAPPPRTRTAPRRAGWSSRCARQPWTPRWPSQVGGGVTVHLTSASTTYETNLPTCLCPR
jgi:hypothetical protein